VKSETFGNSGLLREGVVGLVDASHGVVLSGFIDDRREGARTSHPVLAVRLHDFGNLLRDLAPGATLLRENLRAVLFKTSSRWSYLLYVVRASRREVAGPRNRALRCEPHSG